MSQTASKLWHGQGRRIYMQEVGTRDGLQMESVFVPTEDKIALVNALSETGLAKIEVTSFVSPKAIPALRDAEIVMREIERVLLPGGFAHVVTPFCHPFHEYPKDFRRFTPDGLALMRGGLRVVAQGWRTGPTATLLVFVLEYAKLLLPWRWWRGTESTCSTCGCRNAAGSFPRFG